MRIEDALSERDVHDFWRNSRYFSRPLLSQSGQTVEVIRRGRYNRDAGPDFRDAVLRLNGTLVQGDIEIHLTARDWYQHGHHADPGYNRVILHLSCDSEPPPDIRSEDGRVIPALVIPLHLFGLHGPGVASAAETASLFDCPLSERSHQQILATIEKAARDRLENRIAALAEQLTELSWDQLLYEQICDALGFAKNRQPFRELARRVPIDLIFNELRLHPPDQACELVTALLFGAAGFLEQAKEGEKWDPAVRSYVGPRRVLWQTLQHALQIQPLPQGSWQFFRLRPQNFPTRRIAALAELVLRFFQAGMLETVLRIVAQKKSAAEAGVELRRFFIISASEFWRTHYHFKAGSANRNEEMANLLGESRAGDLVVNTVLPLLVLYGREAAAGSVANRALEVYLLFPALQENGITRAMRKQLGLSGKRRPKGAFAQQGLIHLHKMYCTPLYCEPCLGLRPQADEH